jgi:hypothetical protein
VEALGGEEGGGTRCSRAVTSGAAELTVERGEGEAGEDFSSQPTCADKAAGNDRDCRWRRQGSVEGGPLVVTGTVAFARGTR